MQKNREISILSPIFPPDIGGPASYVFELSQRLKKNFDINIIAFCEERPVRIKNVDIHTINPKKYGFLGRQLRLFWKLSKYAKNSEALYIQGPIVVGFTGIFFAKWKKIPTAMKFVGDIAWEEASRTGKTVLDLEGWLKSSRKDFKSWLLQKVQKWTFKNAGKIVVPSNFLKDILSKYYAVDESKIEMIYNAFESESKNKKHVEKAYKLMAAGRLVPHKKMDLIIDAMSKLPEKYLLDIYGSGPEFKKLEKKINDLKLDSRVMLRGNLNKNSYIKEIDQHDIFLLYSNYEGLPHVILEAFSRSCPVIASDIPGTNEVAINGETAILAEANNPVRLAEAIRNLSWEKKTRENLSKKALKKLKEDFSWDKHLQKIKELL